MQTHDGYLQVQSHILNQEMIKRNVLRHQEQLQKKFDDHLFAFIIII